MCPGGFIRSDPGLSHPNLQFHFVPSHVRDHGRLHPLGEAFQVHVDQLRPTSRGSVTLASPDPRKHPLIDPNYLDTEHDRCQLLDVSGVCYVSCCRHEMRQCVKKTREIFSQPAFDEYRGRELAPGPEFQTDEEIDEFVRQKSDTDYHPSSTCRMGAAGDSAAVVDSECRVLGLESLRVVDASIMPSIVSGNLNAPTIMMAEKAADMIKGKRCLLGRNMIMSYGQQ